MGPRLFEAGQVVRSLIGVGVVEQNSDGGRWFLQGLAPVDVAILLLVLVALETQRAVLLFVAHVPVHRVPELVSICTTSRPSAPLKTPFPRVSTASTMSACPGRRPAFRPGCRHSYSWPGRPRSAEPNRSAATPRLARLAPSPRRDFRRSTAIADAIATMAARSPHPFQDSISPASRDLWRQVHARQQQQGRERQQCQRGSPPYPAPGYLLDDIADEHPGQKMKGRARFTTSQGILSDATVYATKVNAAQKLSIVPKSRPSLRNRRWAITPKRRGRNSYREPNRMW